MSHLQNNSKIQYKNHTRVEENNTPSTHTDDCSLSLFNKKWQG